VRPPSVLAFERLFLLSLLLVPLQAALGWDELMRRGSPGETIAILGLTVVTLAGLALLVSRGRSASAKLVLVLLLLIGLPLFLLSAARGTIAGSPALALLQAALQAASVCYLFTASAREWIAGR
jgi:hypothetical protein